MVCQCLHVLCGSSDNRVGNCKNIKDSNECNDSEFCEWDDEQGVCTALSTDETFGKISDNNNLVSKFLQILKQASIDCVVNSVANNSGVNCSFDPSNPLRKINSQYKENMEDDKYQTSCDKINTKENCDKSQSCYWKPESIIEVLQNIILSQERTRYGVLQRF